MPHTPNIPPTRVLQLIKRIEVETDRETLVQLFTELNLLVNGEERRVQRNKKTVPLHWLRPKQQKNGST